MPIAAKRTKSLTVTVTNKPKPGPKPNHISLSPEEKIAQRALIVTEEASLLVARISSLDHADLSIEQSVIRFRDEVIRPGKEEVHQAFDPQVESAKSNLAVAKCQLDKYLTPWEKSDQDLRSALNNYYSMVKEVQRRNQIEADRQQAENERLAAIQRDQERIKLEKSIEKKIDSLPVDTDPRLIEKLLAPLEEYDGPQPVAPPVIVSEPELTGAMTQTPNWKGAVIEGREMDILRRIVAGGLPISLVEFRGPELNRLAKVYQNKMKIDGLRFWNEPFVRGVGGR